MAAARPGGASHTVNPTLSEFDGNAEVVAGDYALRQYSGAVNVPLGDSLAVRASVCD
jgi:iron complex outermembrane receptor protein